MDSSRCEFEFILWQKWGELDSFVERGRQRNNDAFCSMSLVVLSRDCDRGAEIVGGRDGGVNDYRICRKKTSQSLRERLCP